MIHHNMITLLMLNICDEFICKPLEITSRSRFYKGKFSSEWKKVKKEACLQKGNKQELKKYHPISLLPVLGKRFERLSKSIFKLFTENNSMIRNLSCLATGDPCSNLFVPIRNQIMTVKQFMFLDISKAFDKVWHKDLIFKLKKMMYPRYLHLSSNLIDFFKIRKHRKCFWIISMV